MGIGQLITYDELSDLSNYWHVWRVEHGAHIFVTSLLWWLDCSLLVI